MAFVRPGGSSRPTRSILRPPAIASSFPTFGRTGHRARRRSIPATSGSIGWRRTWRRCSTLLTLRGCTGSATRWAGFVGLGMMRRNPARFLSFATFGTVYRMGLPAASPAMLPLLYRVMGRSFLSRVTGALTTSNPAAQRLIAEMIAAFDPGPGERVAQAVRAYDLRASAQQFAGPVLLIRGGKDRAVNLGLGSTFEAMAGHKDFQRIDLPEGGHCANLDAPNEMRAALDAFWRRVGARPVSVGRTLSSETSRLRAT
jgi:pimeloyl-ACP methyl ester carboxylesterase